MQPTSKCSQCPDFLVTINSLQIIVFQPFQVICIVDKTFVANPKGDQWLKQKILVPSSYEDDSTNMNATICVNVYVYMCENMLCVNICENVINITLQKE